MIADKGWPEPIEIVDEAVSAFSGANLQWGELAKFAENVKAGIVLPGSILIAEKIDRLSRIEPRRVLWNFWPCHWKGWLIQTAAIVGGLATVGFLAVILGVLGRPEWTPFAFLAVLAAVLITLEVIARRHCPDPF